MVRTAIYEARTKSGMATVSLEAGLQRGTEHMKLEYPSADRQTLTSNDARHGIVNNTHSNVVSECAETLNASLRQHPSTVKTVWLSEHSGVTVPVFRSV